MKTYTSKISLTLNLLLIGFYIFLSCSPKEEPNWVSANLKIEIASRGVIQYLIEINDQLYYPENLPVIYKNPQSDSLEIRIKFKNKNYTKDIYQPSPNDIPFLAYTVPVIQIIKIEKR
jgi:hypothetical protein